MIVNTLSPCRQLAACAQQAYFATTECIPHDHDDSHHAGVLKNPVAMCDSSIQYATSQAQLLTSFTQNCARQLTRFGCRAGHSCVAATYPDLLLCVMSALMLILVLSVSRPKTAEPIPAPRAYQTCLTLQSVYQHTLCIRALGFRPH